MDARSVKIHTAGGMALLLAVAAAQVWGRSGSPWMWLLVVLLVTVVLGDGLLSFVALRRIEISAVGAPDSQVGRADPLLLTVNRPRGRCLVKLSSLADAPWVRVDAPSSGEIPVVPEVRGVFSGAWFAVAVRAPLGLVSVTRQVLVELPQPVVVAPAPIGSGLAPLTQVVDPDRPGIRSDELPRGVREYVPGDSHRQVHWPATARSGRLMVRDLAAATTSEIELVVDLGTERGPVAERVASLAMGIGLDLLDRGHRLVLTTVESLPQSQAVTLVVADRTDLGRRLARADVGSAPDQPAGAFVVDARLLT
jgi:uncharacterized protein (DUF58 family)